MGLCVHGFLWLHKSAKMDFHSGVPYLRKVTCPIGMSRSYVSLILVCILVTERASYTDLASLMQSLVWSLYCKESDVKRRAQNKTKFRYRNWKITQI